MEEYRKWLETSGEDAEEQQAVAATEPAGDEAAEADMADMLAALKDDLEAKLRETLEEAVRLNGMSPEERTAYDAQTRLKALEEREKALERRELKADAQEKLAELGLPAGLAEALNCEDRAAMEKSVRALGEAFHQAVQAAVEARLKGVSPAAGASAQETGDELDDEAYYSMQGKRL